ncbi:sensor histidine kinase [Noviherbaspirillum aridicola]|nr:HAMP domain-containing sensor histidine kinase [Noviherbaspirillum aridicola]
MTLTSKLLGAFSGPVQTGAGEAPADAAAGNVFSVRSKGLIVFSLLIAYALMIAVFVFHQKNRLLTEFDHIAHSVEADTLYQRVDNAATHVVMSVFANIDSDDREAAMRRIGLHYEMLRMNFEQLRAREPQLRLSLQGPEAALRAANADPTRAALRALAEELVALKDEFAGLAQESQRKRQFTIEHYRGRADSVAMTTLLLGVVGVALLYAVGALFFRRLTSDLVVLQKRGLEIVNGYRGPPIPIRRHDEVGQLMAAVNYMATALDKREKELILERQKYFHQEKMAAIGALAAGVAHEIGNPIAAISGIAQDMVERRTHGLSCSRSQCGDCRPDMILEQASRLASITREISEFASPRQAEPQLLDLNAQLRSTTSLVRYDKRLQRVDLRLELDPALPAIHGVPDQVTQVIMNLLLNAMDALEEVTDRQPVIVVSTGIEGDSVRMCVEDNGSGMPAEVAERAFEAFYTTKPAGKGTGLGLSLCYSIMKNHGGGIEIQSTPGRGTRVQVNFPCNNEQS